MKLKFMLAFGMISILILGFPASVFAHGSTQVGDYQVEIGFRNEPVYQGVVNGIEVIVTNTKTKEKVNGLEDTLQAEVIHGAAKKTLKLAPEEDADGTYTADIIPTDTGDYTFHVFGKIEDTLVDITMTSAPDTFNSVEPISSVTFPGNGVSTADLTAQTAAEASKSQTALILGGIGAVLGLSGLVVALISLRRGR
jgi:hypothetical protein